LGKYSDGQRILRQAYRFIKDNLYNKPTVKKSS